MTAAREDDPERTSPALRLRDLLRTILPHNAFYAAKFAGLPLDDPSRLPFTTKAELLADQAAHPPYGSNLTYPRGRYSRLHQTSGTSGRPLRWLDTPESWSWMLDGWDRMFALMGLRADDRLFFPFSFGPFLGFWTAFEAAARRGFFCLPGGGMSGGARLRFLLDNEVTVVFCTPTYALHLGEAARAEGIDLAASPVRALVVAGEPGGGIAPTRQRIETAWGARVFDHSGLTEVGPMAVECVANPMGLHVLEDSFLVEVIDPATAAPLPVGEVGEMVVTNLGRLGSPLIRYRTGDMVRVDPRPCPCGSPYPRLDGGILGRGDDMIHLRGNNVYPSAIESLLRRFPEVAEYRIEIDRRAALSALRVEVEATSAGADEGLLTRLDQAFRDEFLFRAEVRLVPPGTLPRFEMKAKRINHREHREHREGIKEGE